MFNFIKKGTKGEELLEQLLKISKEQYSEYMKLPAANSTKRITNKIKKLSKKEQEILKMIDDPYEARRYCIYLEKKIREDAQKVCPWYLRVKNFLVPKAAVLDKDFFPFENMYNLDPQKVLNLQKLSGKVYEEYLAQICFFLREKINNSNELYERKLKAAYYIFLYEVAEVEKKIGLDDFNVPNEIYLGSKLWAEYLKIPDEIYYGIAQEDIREECFENIMCLLNFKNEAFLDVDNIMAVDIRICQIKAGIIYYDRDSLERLKEYILDKFSDDSYSIVYGYLNEIFKSSGKIRSKYYVVSYKNKQ